VRIRTLSAKVFRMVAGLEPQFWVVGYFENKQIQNPSTLGTEPRLN